MSQSVVDGRSPDRAETWDVGRLAAEVVARLPDDDPAPSGGSPSYMTRRWKASRQAGVDRLVGQVLAGSSPHRPLDPELEQRVIKLVGRLLQDRTAGGASPARIAETLGSGI